MSDINDGGPAFPSKTFSHFKHVDPNGPYEFGLSEPVFVETEGMSLRDWFAGQALSGILSAPMHNGFNALSKEKYAKEAYWFADAMVKARNGEAS